MLSKPDTKSQLNTQCIKILKEYLDSTKTMAEVESSIKDLASKYKSHMGFFWNTRANYLFSMSLDPNEIAMIKTLNTEISQVVKFGSINDLLDQLIANNKLYHRPNYLKNIIDKTSYDINPAWYFLSLSSIISACSTTGLALLYTDKLADSCSWTTQDMPAWILDKFLWAAKHGPVLGLGFHSIILVYTLWYGLSHDEKQSTCKWEKITSETIRLSMILLGHILNICLIACPWLFIAAVIIEGTEAGYEYFTMPWQLVQDESMSAHDFICLKNQHDLLCQQRLCHLIVAILLVACVVCWNLFPPSLALSLACVLFIAVVVITRECIKAQLSTCAGANLQNELSELRWCNILSVNSVPQFLTL